MHVVGIDDWAFWRNHRYGSIVCDFPETTVQTCIVHLMRNSLDFASWKDRKELAGGLKAIYAALDDTAAEAALTAFEASPWGQKYPAIGQI